MPWVACDREIVVLIDRQHNLELVGEALSAATNYRQTTVGSVGEALAFAEAVQFPSHGLVVMPEQNPKDNREICKGIVQEHQLMAAVEHLLKTHPSVWIETDMRAHMNPSRMGGDSSRHRRFGAKDSANLPWLWLAWLSGDPAIAGATLCWLWCSHYADLQLDLHLPEL